MELGFITMKWRLLISASNGACERMMKWRMQKNDIMALAKE